MALDSDFMKHAESLYHAEMGTESIAPLLYSIVRFTRPKNILEIGAGYTTLFLLKGLADNAADHQAEVKCIKTHLSDLSEGKILDPNEDPKLIHKNFEYYLSEYTPKLYTVDDFSNPHTTANLVLPISKKLKLDKYLSFHKMLSQKFAKKIRNSSMLFDLIWLDAGNYAVYKEYQETFFKYVNPDGGFIVIHSTETNLEGLALIRQLKLKQATTDFNNFELMSMLEPHKRFQNSFAIIRSTTALKERIYSKSS